MRLVQALPLDGRLVERRRRLGRVAGPEQIAAEIPLGLGQVVPEAVAIRKVLDEASVYVQRLFPGGDGSD